MYPSEYAYWDKSVTRSESDSANCRRYPPGNFRSGSYPEDFIHCDGTQLKLADSIFGQEQYQTTDFYVWSAYRDGQFLFTFPTRVSLTTITVHYYSDNIRGLPRLRFYVVPDDFDVWDTPTTSTPRVEVAAVPPGGERAGRRNINININFITKKVLMYKYTSSFVFSVSEMDSFALVSIYTFILYVYRYVLRLAINTGSTTTDSMIQAISDTFTTKGMLPVLRSIIDILIVNVTIMFRKCTRYYTNTHIVK